MAGAVLVVALITVLAAAPCLRRRGRRGRRPLRCAKIAPTPDTDDGAMRDRLHETMRRNPRRVLFAE